MLVYIINTIQPSDIVGHIEGTLANYLKMDNLVAPTLPVKYPRTPGYRPEPEDNNCNAWCVHLYSYNYII